MSKLRYLFGCTGFIALLGFVGVFTEERIFLSFFAFAVDFEYFFVKTDEMWDSCMTRYAARAFCLGMITMGLTAFVLFLTGQTGASALVGGLAAGWAAAVVSNALMVALYSFRASREIGK